MKKVLIYLLLVVLCLCLSGCQVLMQGLLDVVADKAEESGTTALARQFVNGLLAGDADLVDGVLTPEISRESVEAATAELGALLPAGVSDYTLVPTYLSMQTDNGTSRETIQFVLHIGEKSFLLETLRISGYEGICHVSLQEIEPDAGSEAAAPPSPLWTVISLAVTSTAFGVLIWAIVDALRRPLNRRWLWLLVIILGNLLITFTAANGQIHLNGNLGLYLSVASITMSEGSFGLKVMLPVGSAVYLANRKKLHKPTGAEGFSEAFADNTGNTPAATEASDESEEV